MALIVQAANFVAPHSGGIRTALDALGRGYLAAGHDRVLLVPGSRDADTVTPAGRRISLRGVPLPSSGGYRVLVERGRVLRLLERLAPDRLEVSDKLTLRCIGPWARARGAPAVLVSHERLDQLLSLWLPGSAAAPGLARAWNRRLAAAFDTVVCSTDWAAEEFRSLGLGSGRVARVPLGVDLECFHPGNASPRLRRRLAPDGGPLLVYAGRLATEKRPELAVATLAELLGRWPKSRLVVAGSGPLGPRLAAVADGLPVSFLGYVADRRELAALLATADVALAPGPVETFGLAALEALASGTPVVVARTGALPELLGDSGSQVSPSPSVVGTPGLRSSPSPSVDGALRSQVAPSPRVGEAPGPHASPSPPVSGAPRSQVAPSPSVVGPAPGLQASPSPRVGGAPEREGSPPPGGGSGAVHSPDRPGTGPGAVHSSPRPGTPSGAVHRPDPARVGPGLAAHPVAPAMADAVAAVLAWDPVERRASARARAESFPWSATVAGMLDVHRLEVGP